MAIRPGSLRRGLSLAALQSAAYVLIQQRMRPKVRRGEKINFRNFIENRVFRRFSSIRKAPAVRMLRWSFNQIMFATSQHAHFIGIGGIA